MTPTIYATSILSGLQSILNARGLIELLNVASWMLIPVIFVWGAWNFLRALAYGPGEFEESLGNRVEQWKRWQVWFANAREKLEVEYNTLENNAAIATNLGFLGTTLGIISLLAKFGDGANGELSIEGLHTAFYTTAAGIICALAIQGILIWKDKRIQKKLLLRDFQLQIEVGLFEVSEFKSSSGGDDERFHQLERLFYRLQDKIEWMEDNSQRDRRFPFSGSDRDMRS